MVRCRQNDEANTTLKRLRQPAREDELVAGASPRHCLRSSFRVTSHGTALLAHGPNARSHHKQDRCAAPNWLVDFVCRDGKTVLATRSQNYLHCCTSSYLLPGHSVGLLVVSGSCRLTRLVGASTSVARAGEIDLGPNANEAVINWWCLHALQVISYE